MSDNQNNGFVFRFGTLKAFEQKNAATGTTYADFAVDAGKFTAYGRVFDAGIIAAMAAATIGDKIRVGGFIESNTVKKDDGSERTYLRLMTRWAQINDDEPVKVAKVEAEAEAAA